MENHLLIYSYHSQAIIVRSIYHRQKHISFSKLCHPGQALLILQNSFFFYLGSHSYTLRLGRTNLVRIVAVKLYLLLKLLQFSESYPRSFWTSGHLRYNNLILLDCFLKLGQNNNGPLLHILVLGPVDHVIFVLTEGSIEHLRCVIKDPLFYPEVLVVDVGKESRCVVK